jgi:hypothetical protein
MQLDRSFCHSLVRGSGLTTAGIGVPDLVARVLCKGSLVTGIDNTYERTALSKKSVSNE